MEKDKIKVFFFNVQGPNDFKAIIDYSWRRTHASNAGYDEGPQL